MMTINKERREQLRRKYGENVIDNAAPAHAEEIPAVVEWADELDQHYAKIWLEYTHGGMYRRGILDERTRNLIVIGQLVVTDEMEELSVFIRAALASGATPREAFEVILQSGVYVGYPKVTRAVRVFRKVIDALGRLDEITETQLPLDGRNAQRSLDEERAGWRMPEEPRREALLEKYGWQSLSPGLRLQPTHHFGTVERLDRVDQSFVKLWLDFIYRGMYTRGILDDKTRILCIVAELFAVGDLFQAENHVRGALIHGASPRELLEVFLQSTIYVGMPRFARFVALLERVLEEQGRLAELTDTQLPLPR